MDTHDNNHSMQQPGVLYTLSYAARDAYELIECLVALDVIIADIRLSPNSHDPWWRQPHLRQWLGGYYWHLPALGNLRYQDRDHQHSTELSQPDSGIAQVTRHLRRGEHLALVCACAQRERCHRTLVAELVQVQLPNLTVIHL